MPAVKRAPSAISSSSTRRDATRRDATRRDATLLQHRKRRLESADHRALGSWRVLEHGQGGALLCAFGALDDRRNYVHDLGCRCVREVRIDDSAQHVFELLVETRVDHAP
jgi:hypothetical protein